MTIELLYTSAAQGLKQGSRGFCTVVSTVGLPINLAQRLEALSGYRHLYQPSDPRADDNPVCHSHIRLAVGGKTLSILSRVGAYGVDYSQRTNKIAHHVVFDGSVPACGPASVLLQPGIMRTSWDGECKTYPSGPVVPPMSLQPAPCVDWNRITGDAGWAGVVANAWMQPTGKPVWIVFSESQSDFLLGLMQEAIAILPESRRWQATFSTYCTNLPPDVECRVRCVIAGSDEARMSIARGTVLDLTMPLGLASNDSAASAARNGNTIGVGKVPLSAPENSHELEGVDDEITVPFPDDVSEERNYQLQNETPDRSPMPISMHKRGVSTKRRMWNSKNGASELQSDRTKLWKLLSIAAGLLLVVSAASIGIFFLATTKSPITSLVKEVTKPHLELATKTGADPQLNLGATTDDKKTKFESSTVVEIPAAIRIVELLLNEIDENEPVKEEILVARFKVTNATVSEVSLTNGSQYFALRGDKVYLKSRNEPFNYEENSTLDCKLTLKNGNIEELSVRVRNRNDPNLLLSIVDMNRKPVSTNVFAGETLRAEVQPDSKDEDELPSFNRFFSWRGREGNGRWEEFEQKQEIVIDSRYSEVKCELTYETTAPNSKTTVTTAYSILIQPLGIASLDFISIFSATDPEIKIDIAFPSLPALQRNEEHRCVWGKHKEILEGKSLKLTITPKEWLQEKSNLFRPVSDVSESRRKEWQKRAYENSKTVRENMINLKSSVSNLNSQVKHSSTQYSKVAVAFKQFVNKLNAAPDEDFFQSIERAADWVERSVTLKNLVIEIAKDRSELEKAIEKHAAGFEIEVEALRIKIVERVKLKSEELKHLVSQFKIAFRATTPLPQDSENEIAAFAEYWDWRPKANDTQVPPPKPNQTPFNNLSSSIRDLRETMNSCLEFETVLVSKEKISIWANVPSPKSGNLEPKLSEDGKKYDDPFRVRTRIIFKNYEPKKSD